jgi:hypothetical protein
MAPTTIYEDQEDSSLYAQPSRTLQTQSLNRTNSVGFETNTATEGAASGSSSPTPSASSDKENRVANAASTSRQAKGISRTMTDSISGDSRASSEDVREQGQQQNKRRRLQSGGPVSSLRNAAIEQLSTPRGHSVIQEERFEDLRVYNPEQSMERRREVRRGLRSLNRTLIGRLRDFSH